MLTEEFSPAERGGAPLLERAAELGELARLLADAREGSGRHVVIRGPAGIGKTRLVEEARALAAADGMSVLAARGGELERDFAFGVVRQLLEPALRAASTAEREELMGGAAEFAGLVLGQPAVESWQGGDPSYAVLHGLYWFVANLAERRPLVLAVDDAHWADRPSLRFLAFLARRLEGMRVLVVLAARSGEPGAESDLLEALSRELGRRAVEPGPLSEGAVGQVVRSTLGQAAPDALCLACHQVTRGNPFMLGELLIEIGQDGLGPGSSAAVKQLGPRGVARAVLVRLARLPPAATELARAVAILGEHADLGHAAALAGLGRGDALCAADALASAAVMEAGRPLRFVHPIVRTAIHADMPAADRAHAHARAARLLAEDEVAADRVALQLLAAEPAEDAWVVETLRDAARGALRRGAPEVAARYLRRALSEPPLKRAEVLLELGAAEARAGEPDARTHLQAALGLAREPTLRARATVELTQVVGYETDVEQAARITLRTREELRDEPELARWMDTLLLVFAETELAARRMTRETVRRADRMIERLGRSAPRYLLAIVAFERALVDGTADDVVPLAERALAGGSMTEEINAEAPHPYFAAMALTLADRGALAERHLTSAIATARLRGSARGFALASTIRALNRYHRGALAGAEADARACLELGPQAGWQIFRPAAVATLVDALVERGALGAAAAALEEAGAERYAPESLLAQPLRESLARLRLAQGRPREALAELGACARWEEDWGAHNGLWMPWRSAAAVAHASLGEAQQARGLAADELARARRFGASRGIGIALSASGFVEGGTHGVDLLREAVRLLERSDSRLEHARALVRLGAVLRRERRLAPAREPLRSGLDLAQRRGATALAEIAHRELVAAGARPRRRVLRGADALTPSERRVAETAAAGKSNREIAQSLFLTVRTIEMHLSNAYRKLNIQSRHELARALAASADEQAT